VRVSTGKYQRRELLYPRSGLRPTKAVTRLAMFNMVGSMVKGARALDLYAGGGSLGVEALSRGAASCVFIEISSPVLRLLRTNVKGMPGAAVVRDDVLKALKRLKGREFDLVLADPPYVNGLVQPTVNLVAGLGIVVPGGWLVMEHHRMENPVPPEHWELARQTNYGDSCVSILRRQK
jgi:16S rRNA (guanine(966)-N(2))-methyltransferase RsmD